MVRMIELVPTVPTRSISVLSFQPKQGSSIVIEDLPLRLRRKAHAAQTRQLVLRIPHGVIRAEQHTVRTVGVDERAATSMAKNDDEQSTQRFSKRPASCRAASCQIV